MNTISGNGVVVKKYVLPPTGKLVFDEKLRPRSETGGISEKAEIQRNRDNYYYREDYHGHPICEQVKRGNSIKLPNGIEYKLDGSIVEEVINPFPEDPAIRQNGADCGLVSSAIALMEIPTGKKALKRTVEINPEDLNVRVRLAGEKPVEVPLEELTGRQEGCIGTIGIRAIEKATAKTLRRDPVSVLR